MSLAVSIEGLRKTYQNGFEALKGVTLHIEPGDFFGLLGHNGAGKSTLISVLSSLVHKTAGLVSVFGFDIDTQLSQIKPLIGLVPQELNLNSFETPKQILINQAGYYGIPRKEACGRADELLQVLELSDKSEHATRMLSGGMKRRLMIARALMHSPKLLILDEPTAGVDVEIRHDMWQFLTRLNESGTTILLTTHYLEEAEQLCRNIGIVQDGVLLEQSPTKALLKKIAGETFVLELSEPVQTLPQGEGFTLKTLDPLTLELHIENKDTLLSIFSVLHTANLPLQGLKNKMNRLEALFLSLSKKGGAA